MRTALLLALATTSLLGTAPAFAQYPPPPPPPFGGPPPPPPPPYDEYRARPYYGRPVAPAVGFTCRTAYLTCDTGRGRPLGSRCQCETDDGDTYFGRVRP